MYLYYVRHGDPIYDPDSLTALGHEQAKALSKRFAIYGLDEIYASTSMRAQMTAQPTCDVLHKEKILLDWANEGYAWADTHIVSPEGKPSWVYASDLWRENLNHPEVVALGKKWNTHPIFKGTPLENGTKRIDDCVDEFMLNLGFMHNREKCTYKSIKQPKERIALFAHEGFGKLFLSSLLDIPYPLLATRFELGHSSVTVIYFDESGEERYPRVLQWSNDSHLYKEGVSTKYWNFHEI
ncbi:MAG: histidine phosphatase family protein [Clostridiales bacterium]|nr:histidine phosphatase family protein [Clostridiales bacterium]